MNRFGKSVPGRTARALYALRWPLSALAAGIVISAVALGTQQVARYSQQVNQLSDSPEAKPKPHLFDPRSDIWFEEDDPGLLAQRALEASYVSEDLVVVSFEETEDPWGAFGTRALETVDRLSTALEGVPLVRNVRSLTTNPWIRWEELEGGEAGLHISDLFEESPSKYSEDERLHRMVAVLGAERASQIAGADRVREVLGADADFSDFIGEPRLIRGVISEDGRTSAIQLQLLRPAVGVEKLDEVFPPQGASTGRDSAPKLYKSTAQSKALALIDEILEEERATSGYTLHLAGNPVVERHIARVGAADMAYTGLMFLAIAGVLLLAFRRIGAMTLPLLVVIATQAGMFGIIWSQGLLLNSLTAITPIIITAIGVADAVHLIASYYTLRPEFSDKRSLMLAVLERNMLPVFLTSATTAVGFLSLLSSSIGPIQEFAFMAGLGTVLAYALSMVWVPALLSLVPVKGSTISGAAAAGAPLERRRPDESLVALAMRHRGVLLGGALALTAMGIVGLSRVGFATNVQLLFRDSDPMRRDLTWTEDHLGGVGDLELMFQGAPANETREVTDARRAKLRSFEVAKLSSGESPWDAQQELALQRLRAQEQEYQAGRIAVSPDFLDAVTRMERRIEKESKSQQSPLRVVSRIDSALDVLRKMHQVQSRNAASAYRVPYAADIPEQARAARLRVDPFDGEKELVPSQDASTLVSQYYLQFENSAKPSETLSTLITPDRRGFRMTMRVDLTADDTLLRAVDRIREIAAEELGPMLGSREAIARGTALTTLDVTGNQYLFSNMFSVFSSTLVSSLAVALLVITLLIAAVFRSPVLGLVSLVPNVLPIVVPLAVMGLLGIAVDGPSVVVASVALGVCVDDTIHLLSKFTRARSNGASSREAVLKAIHEVGPALTWTTITLMLGFSVLMFASFRPNIMVGVLGVTMIGLAWLADFVLTPALLTYLKPRSVAETHAAPSPSPAE